MASPIPICITPSPTVPPPQSAASKRFPHVQGLTVNTTDLTPRKMFSDTPPVTPAAKDSLTVSGSICSCSTDYEYQFLQQSALTPPRTPKCRDHMSLDFPRNPTKGSEASSMSTSTSGFVFVDSSGISSGLSSYSSDTLSIGKDRTGSQAHLTPFAPKGSFSVLNGARPFGSGAWSIVSPGLFTRTSAENTEPEIIAVKKPEQNKGIPILTNEAAILSYLSTPEPTRGVILFYGFDEETTSLLLPAYPLTLESFVKASHKFIDSEQNISLSTLRCPVVKMRQWLFLAKKLCEGFVALKEKRVVHGDVKWGNVLLREYTLSPEEKKIWGENDEKQLYEPLIVDFSSSHVEPAEPKAISALTIPFCAPELLEAWLAPVEAASPVPTFSSDLYSMALTLLTAAIGSDPYSVRIATDATKGMWVKCGDPVGFVRSWDERGLRVRKGEVVDTCLAECFGKTKEGRTTVETVLERVESWIELWCMEGKGDDRWGC
ncbi:kinase-like domain-containing protein [Terfezia claveryi]|nr:kinase-like domain-containing protein [Terfezia claveryi]